MKRTQNTRKQKQLQKKKKLISDFFNFIGTSCTLLFINYMTGPGYWWALWPVGFYGLAIFISFLNYIRDEITIDMAEDEMDYLEDVEVTENDIPEFNKQQSHNPYEDALELGDIPRSRKKQILEDKKWDDNEMV